MYFLAKLSLVNDSSINMELKKKKLETQSKIFLCYDHFDELLYARDFNRMIVPRAGAFLLTLRDQTSKQSSSARFQYLSKAATYASTCPLMPCAFLV